MEMKKARILSVKFVTMFAIENVTTLDICCLGNIKLLKIKAQKRARILNVKTVTLHAHINPNGFVILSLEHIWKKAREISRARLNMANYYLFSS
jgi:hypothetical protein